MGRPLALVILCSLVLGCGSEARPAPSVEEPASVEAAPEPGELPEELPEEEVAPASDELPASVEDMTRPELEAACFEGRQAACDLLGH